ncbi:MAG TPA: pitrilysin family protein [Thermodesulfovibrionales bacterium]|nr:pitrilysin family protein [Thermodesulfovibrionales bacterium]
MKASRVNFGHALIFFCILQFLICGFSHTAVSAFSVNRSVLPNGLVVLHSENHNLPIVMVTLIVKAGQIDETAEKAGLANLTAALMPEGTNTRLSAAISEETDFIGAALGVSAGTDYTSASLSVLKKDLRKGFEIFSDVLLNPSFPIQEIERKKAQITGSLRQREEEPGFLAERAFRKEVFGEHAYGRLIEGSPETLKSIGRDDLVRFHKDYFLPNNSILAVVGDVTAEELSGLLKNFLGGWEPGALLPPAAKSPEALGTKHVIKIEKDLTQANILLGNIGISRDNSDYYAVSVMNYILGGGGFSSRMMQSIRDKMGLAYDVHSFFASYKYTGFFQVGLQTRNESANTAIAEMIKQIEKMKTEEVSDEELSEAKAYLTGSFPRRLDTNKKIADFLASIEFFNLGLDFDKKYPDYINAVTKRDVLRVAKKYLNPEAGVLVVVADQKKAGLKY